MCKKRLDSRDRFPSGMEDYLSMYGWHFSKKLCEFAISRMRDRNGNKISMTKEQAEELLKRNGVQVNSEGYDHVYVMAMAKADHYGSAINDEAHLALFVRDYLQDPDGYDEVAMTRFYADCIGSGTVISWEDVI